MNCSSRIIILISISTFSLLSAYPQEAGTLMVDGIVTSAGKPVDGAEVKIFRDKGKLLFRTTNSSGKFRAKLELGAEYVISAGLPGSTTQTFNFITEVPENRKKESFNKQIEIDLNPLTADAKGKKKWEQNAGGVLYKESEGGFVSVNYDLDEWKKQMAEAAEHERLRKIAEEKARAEAEKRRLEIEAKQKEEQAKRDAEEQLRLAAEAKEKSKLDSLAAVQLILNREMEKRKLAAEQKKTEENRLKELTKAEQEKKRAEAAKIARQQFITDSIANAKMEQIRLASEEKARKEAEAEALKKAGKAREKAVADSIANAKTEQKRLIEEQKTLEKAREKAALDSISNAKAEQKRFEDAEKLRLKTEEQAKLESERKQREVEEQAQLKAEQEKKAKEEADRLAKIEADRKAQEEASQLAKEEKERILAEKAERDKQEAERIAAEVKAKEEETIRKKEAAAKALYDLRKNNSYTEETVNEAGKTIFITTVKIDGIQNIYKLVTHDWGGLFYYKNGADISDVLYLQELKNAKEQINQE